MLALLGMVIVQGNHAENYPAQGTLSTNQNYLLNMSEV